MAWSTRRLAELGGTTVKAVRHYHAIGLLAEPERAANGYKRYGVEHLVRLLRIRRLVDLGLTPARIAELPDIEAHPEEALRLLDTELEAAVERLQRVRADLALILTERPPIGLPLELAPVAGKLTDADRALAQVLSHVAAPEASGAYLDALQDTEPHPVADAFTGLAADADEQVRQDLADRMTPMVRDALVEYPALDWSAGPPMVAGRTARALAAMMPVLYNAAQRDVLARLARGFATDRERKGRP